MKIFMFGIDKFCNENWVQRQHSEFYMGFRVEQTGQNSGSTTY